MNRNSLAKRLNIARWVTFVVSLLMAANALAMGLGSRFVYRNLYFACVPSMVAGLGLDNDFGFPTLPFTVMALAMAGTYALYWVLSKRRPFFLVPAFVSVTIDSAITLLFIILYRATGAPLPWACILPAAVLHVAALACLWIGVRAWRRMQ